MFRPSYLVDTSAFVRLARDESVHDTWRAHIGAGLLVVCPVTELEILYTARSKAHRDELRQVLHEAYGWVVMPDRAFDRAAEVQNALIDRGTHRSAGPIDLLIAATAELHSLVLLHHDADFLQISAVTGQPVRWLAEPGTIS